MAGLVLPDSARGTWLLCCVALCLSGTGSADVGVTQSPRHLIKGQGGEAVLKCRPISGHSGVSWYQQARGQGPQFLIQYDEMSERDRGNIPDRFSAQQFRDYSSELNVSSLQRADSALDLCASS
ncbi:T-cell receptor beta chain T17T-22 [Pteropus alecto]|nr:T-cell receptor beta chain T17T-22 [Pteropus alecto]